MLQVVGVSFRRAGKIYYFDPNGLRLRKNEKVLVETARGLELGFVSKELVNIDESEFEGELKKVVRSASQEDFITRYKKKLSAYRALKICRRKIKEYGLDMKLVEVEYAYDDSKIIFYFSADGRIDFRNLVRELALIFKKRIELHQIGVRDEAKILGAIGLCGRPVCCNSFMPEFVPVSIKMAKEQSLSLNPERISGVCGRFMCCLKHEYDFYHECAKLYPKVGDVVETPQGFLKVLEQRIAKGSVVFEREDQEHVEYKLSELPGFSMIFEDSGKLPEHAAGFSEKVRELPNEEVRLDDTELEPEGAIREQSEKVDSVIASVSEEKTEEPSAKPKVSKFRILSYEEVRIDPRQEQKVSEEHTDKKKRVKIKFSAEFISGKISGSWNGVPSAFGSASDSANVSEDENAAGDFNGSGDLELSKTTRKAKEKPYKNRKNKKTRRQTGVKQEKKDDVVRT